MYSRVSPESAMTSFCITPASRASMMSGRSWSRADSRLTRTALYWPPAWRSRAGPEYARRHVRMDAAMRAYLTGSEVEQVAPSAAHRAGYDEAMKTLAAGKVT